MLFLLRHHHFITILHAAPKSVKRVKSSAQILDKMHRWRLNTCQKWSPLMTGATSKCICGVQPPEKWLTHYFCSLLFTCPEQCASSASPSSLYYSHHHDRHHHCGRTIDKEDHQEDRFGKPATRTWANSAFTQVQRFSCSISSKKWNAKQLRLTSLKSMDQHFVLLWSTTQGGIHTSHQAPIV